MEEWKQFFSTAPNKSTVFDILDRAIDVAASDFPDKLNREKTRLLDSIQAAGSGGDLGCGGRKSEIESEEPRPLILRIKLPPRSAEPKSVRVETDPVKEAKPRVDEEVNKIPSKSVEPKRVVEINPVKEAKPLCLDEEAKLQATKRKLHDRYEEIESTKRQKRIQQLNYVPNQNFKVAIPVKKANGKHSMSTRKPVANKLGIQRLVRC